MATKDTPPGLLARVANFVRSPSAESPPHELAGAPEEGEGGKQAIKRMIERKAHNDAIRHREFSQLRKLREASPAALSEMAARASFYQDSSGFPVSEGRATTLKKIDEIEAQMSKQWWKGQQGKPAEGVAPARAGAAPLLAASGPSAPESQLDTCNTFAPTMPTDLAEPLMTAPAKAPQPKAAVRPVERPSVVPPARSFEMTGSSGFSNSKMVSIDMGQALSDPVLEDAAIRFANSDDIGAEAVLMMALKGNTVTQKSKDTWTMALMDMYRATGQLANYERLALEFAERSGRAVQPVPVARQPPGLAPARAEAWQSDASTSGFAVWRAPAVLDRAAVAHLQVAVVAGRTPALLDWGDLHVITPEAAVALAGLMAQWCDQPLTLQFDHLETLDALLRVSTPIGDRQVARFWWQLRLNTLRVLGSQEEFELVSMDYCVTYEVSPPAWQSVRCRRAFGSPAADVAGFSTPDDSLDTTSSGPLTEPTPFVDASASRLELSGEVLGTAAVGLNPLQDALRASGDVLVSCESLVRVDFSAAGSILNWVASAQATGKKIEFCRLPHLVAAFFNLIGINEHARVTTRAT